MNTELNALSLIEKINVLNRLIKRLTADKLINNQKDLSTVINIDQAIISRSKSDSNAREEEVRQIIECILLNYQLDIQDGEIVAKNGVVVLQTSLIQKLAGFYKGYFIRSSTKEICEISMHISLNGEVKYRSARLQDKISKGKVSLTLLKEKEVLWLTFENEKQRLVYVFQAHLHEEKYLNGVYSGFIDQSGSAPVNGLTILIKQNISESEEEGEDVYFDGSLRNYNLEYEEHVNDLLLKEPAILTFFFGKVYGTIHSSTVNFFQRLRFVPHFEQDTKNLAGNYLLYGMGSKKDTLLIKPVKILEDGRVKVKLSRKKAHPNDEYWGRIHSFKNCLSICINQKILATDKKRSLHNIHYLFDSNGITDREDIGRLNGLSCIVNSSNQIVSAKVVLIPTNERYEDTASLHIGNKNNMTEDQLAMFVFFQKSTINKVLQKPGASPIPSSSYGNSFFYSACFHAHKDRFEACVHDLKLAILHGFDQLVEFNEELNNGVLKKYRDLIGLEIDLDHFRLIDNDPDILDRLLYF